MLLLMGAGGGQPSVSAGLPRPSVTLMERAALSSRDEGKPGNCWVPALIFTQLRENELCSIPELGRAFLLVPVSSSPLPQPPFLPQILSLNQTSHF